MDGLISSYPVSGSSGTDDITALVQARRGSVVSFVVKATPESFAISNSNFVMTGGLVMFLNYGF